jgi:hypothetical protein
VFSRVDPLPNGRAVVYIYRISEMYGAAIAIDVFVNQRKAVALPNGGYIAYLAEPGSVFIATDQDAGMGTYLVSLAEGIRQDLQGPQERVAFDAEPGMEYFVQLKMKMQATDNAVMYLQTGRTAMPYIMNSRLVESSP